jgi:ATP-dependent exoDNAse (exonuclease V) beta subunit
MSARFPSSPPITRPLADGEARRRIREDLETTFVVEAAAGTGKTTELVARIVALLASGRAKLDEIVAVTFTEKAAGEMKLRLRAGIERTRTAEDASPEVRANLDRSLAMLEAARIGTIHSLCSDLLHEHPLEAEVDPLFEVGAEDETERLFDQAFDRWFQRALSNPPEGVRRLLRRRPRGRDRQTPREVLRDAAYRLVDRRDFDGAWRRDPWDRTEAMSGALDALRAAASVAAPKNAAEKDFIGRNLQKIVRFLEELDRREAVRGRDEDGLEAELRDVQRWSEWRWRGGGFNCLVSRNEAIALRDDAKRMVDAFLDAASADLAACLFAELQPLMEEYKQLKKRAGRLDFLDLLLSARDLLRNDTAVRTQLSTRFSHLFIDEFQDTDPLQAEILLLLAADDPATSRREDVRPRPGKLFVVGDPKQSIYRFRRADVAFYSEVKRQLVGAGAEVLYLSTSFRSAPSLQMAVNAAFGPLMRGDSLSQARYVALEPYRDDPKDRPTIVALPVPRPYSDYGKIVGFRIDESAPDAVAAFIEHLITKSGWTVSERERPEEQVPVAARHVCLLFKRFQSAGEDVTRPYVRALESRRIPHVLVGGRSFHEREEVIALRSALAAIEWPDDELSVFAALRGPFFAVGDDLLIAYRAAHKALHPLYALRLVSKDRPKDAPELPAHEREVAEALAVLGSLNVGRNRRPVADTIGQLLERTRAHAGLAIWPTGEQALANVLRVMDLARRFETRGATSFRAFVERIQDDAQQGEAAEAPVVEEGTDGVRLMTVHRAKGLEFPVVVLADPTAPHTHMQPTRHVDSSTRSWYEPLAGCMPIELFERREEVRARDLEEAHRLAYVAATRARDLLIVPVVGDALVGDDAVKGWVDVLHPVLYPPRVERRDPRTPVGCPPFLGDDTVLDRSKVDHGSEASVAPGLHHPEVGDHTVVWWDPRALPGGAERSAGLRQKRILQADERDVRADGGELRHAAWRARRKQSIERGSQPSQVVRTATEIASEIGEAAYQARLAAVRAAALAEEGAPPVAIGADPRLRKGLVGLEHTDSPREGRPRGKRFGILVHAVLAEVRLAATEEDAGAMAAVQGRLVGATAGEVEAAKAAVVAALRHPLMVRAAKAEARGECRRETPVVTPLEGGVVLDGIIDLAFREETPEGPVWLVIDFKTDTDVEAHGAQYEVQVSLYVDAVAKATGERARGILLSV